MNSRATAKLMVVLCSLALTFGCATSGGNSKTATMKPADDKTAIAKTLGDWGTALGSKNIDTIIAFYSDSFKDDGGRDKNGVKELIQDAISQGYLDGAKVDITGAQISVNGEQAVVAPVTISGNMGALSLSVSLKKEAGNWKIAGSSEA